jgi:two-component system LytT family response regulator
MIGRRLSHYEVLAELGRGGMGIVYRARDTRLSREVALKVLAPDLTHSPDLLRRFVREARTAASLSHPGIAVVHEIDEADGVTFIAMEMVRGEPLSSLIARGPMSGMQALRLASEVAEALGEGHARGIVHRDLKPSNVIVTEEGRAKLIDFGLAKPLEGGVRAEARAGHPDGSTDAMRLFNLGDPDDTGEGRILGTAAYMSPEQARGGDVDLRADVFSFGALLQEMLTGAPAFRRGSPVETLHAVIADPAPRLGLAGAAADVQRIVDTCLEKDPARRYQSMDDLASELHTALLRLDASAAPGAAAPVRAEAPRGAAEAGPLRVVVVDDEDLARAVLREHLAAAGGVLIVGECRNGFEAVKAVSEMKPDLVFLDIQMPKLDGFEVLELIGSDVAVVFVTAFDEHAVRAFEVNAVDYLLKPASADRVGAALERARARVSARSPTPVAELVAAARPDRTHAERVLVRDGAKVHVIAVGELDYAQAQDDYVCLRSNGRDYLKQQALTELAASLDPSRFVRIHRSYLVNVDRLVKIETDLRQARYAILRDGSRLPVSRGGYARLRELL